MSRKYRRKHIDTKPKRWGDTKINKTVQQMLSSKPVQDNIKKFCADYGRSYPYTVSIFIALGDACGKTRGATLVGQKIIAERIGVHKDTVNAYMKDMEEYGLIDLWGRTRKPNKTNNVKWTTTNCTVLTCLFEYAERCAYWYRAAINQKNIAAEKVKVLAKSLIGAKPMHNISNSIVVVKTGEIIGNIEDKPPKRSLAGGVLAYDLPIMEYQP